MSEIIPPAIGANDELFICPPGDIRSIGIASCAQDLFDALDSLVYDVHLQMANPSHHAPFSLARAEAVLARAAALSQANSTTTNSQEQKP